MGVDDDARVPLSLALCRECLPHLVRLGVLGLLGALGWFGLEATRQVQASKRVDAVTSVDVARSNVRAESLALERAKLKPRPRSRFHPDTR